MVFFLMILIQSLNFSDIRSDRILLLKSELFFIAFVLFSEAFPLFSMFSIGRTKAWCHREGFLRQP